MCASMANSSVKRGSERSERGPETKGLLREPARGKLKRLVGERERELKKLLAVRAGQVVRDLGS
jgi:hypothetical protein